MADDNPQPLDSPPNPLDYHQPKATNKNQAIIGVTLGLIVSAILVTLLGFFAFFPAHPDFLSPAPKSPSALSRAFGIAFIALALTAIAFAIRLWKSRPHSRWFLFGFLIGGGLTCLLEGACFSAS